MWTSRLTKFSILLVVGLEVAFYSGTITEAAAYTPILAPAIRAARTDRNSRITPAQSKFLRGLERRCFRYFWDEMNPHNGLIPDRSLATGGGAKVASIAAEGFGLTALCIADQHHWEPHRLIYNRVLTALHFFLDDARGTHGFYYHFLNLKTGRRQWNCNVSSIDTALLMAGVLTVQQHFAGTRVARLAARLYDRVDWSWMLDGRSVLTMGWNPKSGFLPYRWTQFNEGLLIYLLGLGSPTHPLPPSSWNAWRRGPLIHYDGHTFMTCPPLFTHQYPQAWFDLRGQRDRYADYFRDSRYATLANRAMCTAMHKRFPDYGPDSWGITASDSAAGYVAWGGPPATSNINGTLVPCAAGGSIPFAPGYCIETLIHMERKFHKMHIYGRYGFVDAFNPLTGWVDKDVLGIDQGITLIMAENYRTGFVWRTFMATAEARKAMQFAGFHRLNTCAALPTSSSVSERVIIADKQSVLRTVGKRTIDSVAAVHSVSILRSESH